MIEKHVKRTYADSVFRRLFANEKEARDLINLLEGTNFTEDNKIEIQTLDNALFVDKVNDLAFSVDSRLIILIEMQSTINPNMPFRMLQYFSRTLEKLYSNKSFYGSTLVKIHAPEFFVLYNGQREFPAVSTLHLSDAFLTVPGENTAEVVVKVFNIKYNINKELLKEGSTLYQYSRFIDIIRNVSTSTDDIDKALPLIMGQCRSENILIPFLEENGMEAIEMAWGELNWEEYISELKDEAETARKQLEEEQKLREEEQKLREEERKRYEETIKDLRAQLEGLTHDTE